MDIETQRSSTSKVFKTICLNKYRARCFLNKQVVLVLLWIFLIWMYVGTGFTGGSLDLTSSVSAHYAFYHNIEKYFYQILLSTIAVLPSAFASAWFAGWKYRIHDIIFTGMVIAGIGSFLTCVVDITASIMGIQYDNVGVIVLFTILAITSNFGAGPILANLFQLGMEQIPEASAAQLSSLVNWTVFTAVLGSWCSSLEFNFYWCTIYSFADPSSYNSLDSLRPAAIIALTLSTYSLYKHKLMDNSPSSNVIKNIYKVVKYAIKHKHPERRSAMTYWEERIPSRLALGKAKYGGPFTSEQAEDVRTFLQIGTLYLAAILYLITLYLNEYSLYYIDMQIEENRTFYLSMLNSNCYTHSTLFHVAGYNYWWLLVSIPVYEFIIVPVLGYRMPSMLSRVTLSTILAALVSIVLTLLVAFYSSQRFINLFRLQVGLSLPMGIARAIFYTSGLEFICAQSPYAMRNFFVTLGICIGWMCPILSGLIFTAWARTCASRAHCPVIYSATTMALHLLGLAVFWVIIRKYRKRSRGHEDEHQQKWVEDVYDKYVEQEHNFQD